jgi:hypothetical protein
MPRRYPPSCHDSIVQVAQQEASIFSLADAGPVSLYRKELAKDETFIIS